MAVQHRYGTYQRDQRKFFDDLITEDWDSYASEEWDRTRQWEVSKLFEVVSPRRVLDVGCGCGFHDKAMAAHEFVERVDAIDYSSKSVEMADKAYPHVKVRRWTADFREWDVAAEYDLVVSFQVIEHLDDPEQFLEFCRRATRHGGNVAVFTPNRLRLGNLRRMLKLQPPELCDPQHFREYSIREVKAIGQSVGLKPVTCFGYQLHGFRRIDSLSVERRLSWGAKLRPVATNIAVVFRNE